jgi:PKD repeat protein
VSGDYFNDFGGTSGATPTTAGAVGLVYDMYRDDFWNNNPGGADPHAATVKAILINHAYQYPFNQANRYQQGWGFVDIGAVYDHPDDYIVNEAYALSTGQTQSWQFNADSGTPLKISLVWTDVAGAPSASKHLKNDLSLKVTDPNSTVYWGNVGLAGAHWSSSGGSEDHINNVENVFIETPVSGQYTVEVIAYNVPEPTANPVQDFALVVSGGSQGPPNNPPDGPVDPIPSNGAVDVDLDPTLSVYVSDGDGDTMDVTFYDQYGGLIGTDAAVVSGARASALWSGRDYATTYGWYAVADDGTDTTQSATWSFTTVNPPPNDPPGAPANPVPSDGATDIGLSPSLSVSVTDPDGDPMDVTFYDAGDDSVIGTDTGVPSGGTASAVWPGLAYETTYGWYAVADDNISGSTPSATWSFTTENAPPNDPPDVPADPIPADGALDADLSPALSVYVSDANGQSLDVSFYDELGALIGTDTDVASGTRASAVWSGRDYSTTYGWYAVADDGEDSTQSPTWYFTTMDMPVQAFKTQLVKITIPAGSDAVAAFAPGDFDAVNPDRTIVLISGITQHAMGYTVQSSQYPHETSARADLVAGDQLTLTRSSSAAANGTTAWILLVEYIGAGGGPNEFIVRDRRVHGWSSGATSSSYGPVSTVADAARVVVFNSGTENPNTSNNQYDRGDVRAYLNGSKNVQLYRGDGSGAIESSHQVVEFLGSNWTVQTGDAVPSPHNPSGGPESGGTDVSVADVGDIANAWIYFNWQTNLANLDERGHRVWLTSPVNLRVQEHAAATGSKMVRWYIISNAEMTVQTNAADDQFQSSNTANVTGFSPVQDPTASFAWVHGMTNGGGNAHPRDMWQFELADASTLYLQRGYNGQNLDYRYFVIEFPQGIPNNLPDAPVNPVPADGATGIGLDPALSVDVSDPDGDALDVTFYDAADDSVIGTDTNVPSGGTATVTWSGRAYETVYSWYAVADDLLSGTTASQTWSFTTETAPNQPPTAALTADPPSGHIPLTVTFSMSADDVDGTIASWELDIDNDGTAEYSGAGEPPATQQHTYTDAGTYTAELTVWDDEGATGFDTAGVTADPPNQAPAASLSANPASGDAPLTVTFSMSAGDADGSIASWELDVDNDGTPEYSGAGEPPATQQHIYGSPGSYTAELTVWDDDGAQGFDTATVNVSEPPNQPPTAALTADPPSGHVPLTVTFSMSADDVDGTIASWELDIDNDGTAEYSGAGEPPATQQHTYNDAGTYTAELTVWDDEGATGFDTAGVTADPPNQAPAASLSANPASGDAPLTVTFSMSAGDSDGAIASWALDVDNDGTPEYSGAGEPPATQQHTYGSPGVYTAELTVQDDDAAIGFDTATVTVNEPPNQPPTAALTADPVSGHAPLIVTFTMSASDSDGTIASWALDIDNDGTAEYSGAGNPPASQQHTYTDAGTYTAELTVWDDEGATGFDTAGINVDPPNQPPTASLSADPAEGDAPLTVTFSMSAGDADGAIASWELDIDNDGTAEYSGSGSPPATQQHTYTDAGTYTAELTVWDNDGAQGFDTAAVTVNASAQSMHVHSIDMSTESIYWGLVGRAVATVSIVDAGDAAVDGATVNGHWSGLATNSSSGVTNSQGLVTLYSDWRWLPSGTYTFTVDDVQKTNWTYDAASNVETSDSIAY